MSDPVCWCASDIKCPHAIAGKLPLLWDELEKTIDDVLHQFDRRAIKKFLKRDIDGNSKKTLKSGSDVKDVSLASPFLNEYHLFLTVVCPPLQAYSTGSTPFVSTMANTVEAKKPKYVQCYTMWAPPHLVAAPSYSIFISFL